MKKLLSLLSLALSLALPSAAQTLVPSAPDVLRLERSLPKLEAAQPILLAKVAHNVRAWVHPAAPTRNGIIFPANDGATGPTQFKFTGTALIQQYPATYIWQAKYSQQTGYHTCFFREADNDLNYSGDQSYFGCHPYPLAGYRAGNAAAGTTHNFEISADGADYCGQDAANAGPNDDKDDNGNTTLMTVGQWYTHAMVITASGSTPTVKFYWDVTTSIGRVITHTFTAPMPADGVGAYLVWGSSPWTSPYDTRIFETLGGRFRGLKLYTTALTTTEITNEAANLDANTAATSNGTSSLFYSNVNITPSDISDKKTGGTAHNPAWLGTDHGTLFTE